MHDETRSASLRGLATDLREASDSAVLLVTQVLDSMAMRGETDRLLDPLRGRLAGLRPPRPQTLGRLLFSPLDPVIVAVKEWRAGSATIPRSLLAPVLALVRTRLPDRAATQRALAAGDQPPALWVQAAAILSEQPLPSDWSTAAFQAQTGLKPDTVRPLVGIIRLVFAHAAILQPPQEQGQGHCIRPQAVRPLLVEAAQSEPLAWSIILTLLFEHATAPAALVEDVLALTRETALGRPLERGLHAVVQAAVERLGDWEASAAPASPLSDEALEAQTRRAARLAGFSALRGDMLAFAGSLAQCRRQMAALCATYLSDGLRGAQLACARAGTVGPEEEDAAVEGLESRLRALRRLDLAARPLGGTDDREQVLAKAASFYVGRDAPKWLARADRLRLCEMLVGAEAALQIAQP